MCKQKLIRYKFDLKLVTTFSSYWCTAIFTKSRSLHYVLKKQGKLISSEQILKKGMMLSELHAETTMSEKERCSQLTVHGKDLRIETQKGRHSRKEWRFQKQKNDTQNAETMTSEKERRSNQYQVNKYWRKERRFLNYTQKQRRQKKNDAHNSQSTARISELKRRKDDTQGRNDASRNRKMTRRDKRQQRFPERHAEKQRK